jgi:hypothetical protein
VVGDDGGVRPELQMLVESVRSVAAAIPLLLTFQGTGKVHAIVQDESLTAQSLALDGCVALAQFGEGHSDHPVKDWRHTAAQSWGGEKAGDVRGRGLVVQASRNEFYLVGDNYRLFLRPLLPPEQMRDASLNAGFLPNSLAQYVSVDEGHFDEGGTFVVDRRRNGDETNHGVWVEPDCGVVRVLMCD